jgi:hypothetical protein
MERTQGFGDFVGRFAPEQRQNRLGQSLPVGVPVVPDEAAQWAEEAARRLCHELVPPFGHASWRAEGTEEAVNGNRGTFRFGHHLRLAQPQVEALLSACLEATRDEEGRNWFGGMYLAGTGQQPQEQAFVAGAVQKLFDHRKCLAWSPESIEEDWSYRLWSWGAVAGVAVLLFALVAFVWQVWAT